MNFGRLGAGFGRLGGLGGPSGPVLITATDTAFFAASGATWPTYGTATTPPTAYFSATDTYWYVWQAWDGSGRRVYVKTYNATTDLWSGPYTVGTDPLVDDDHGTPSLERDSDGHIHVYWGSHGATAELNAHSNSPDDPTLWTLDTNITANTTYPKPTQVGTTEWLFLRETVTGGSNGVNPLIYYASTFASGVPTRGSKVTAIDFGVSSRVYAGNFVKVGTDIHFAVTFADGDDTFRENIYYYVFDTLDESIRNFDSSVTVAKVAFPIDLATSNTSFRIVNQEATTSFGNVPTLGIDTDGHPHVGYMDGQSGGPYSFKHIWHNGTAWQTPDTVGSFDPSNALHRFDTMGVVPLPAGEVDLYWITASPFGFDRGGDVSKRTWSAGAFGSASVVLAARSTYALDSIAVTRYAPTTAGVDCRVSFSEVSGVVATESGFLRLFAYGDNGFLRRPFQAETQTLCAAMTTAPSAAYKEAIDEWYSSMKGYGLLAKMDVYYTLKAPTQQQAYLNWVDPSLFVLQDVGGGPTFTANSHVAGNGTSTKISTGLTPSLQATKATQNDCGLYVHVLNNVSHDAYFDAGSGVTAFSQLITKRLTEGAIRGTVNSATNANFNVQGTSVGRTSLERSASNLITAVKDGVAAGTAATASTALADGVLHVCGTTSGFSARQIRRMSFGSGFTAAQRQNQRAVEIRFDFATT